MTIGDTVDYMISYRSFHGESEDDEEVVLEAGQSDFDNF